MGGYAEDSTGDREVDMTTCRACGAQRGGGIVCDVRGTPFDGGQTAPAKVPRADSPPAHAPPPAPPAELPRADSPPGPAPPPAPPPRPAAPPPRASAPPPRAAAAVPPTAASP